MPNIENPRIMVVQKLGVFGAKDEDAIIVEIREFFESKGVVLEASSPDLFQNVKQFVTAAQNIAPSLTEKDIEQLLNAIFNLSITLPIEQSLDFTKQLCEVFKSPAFKGTGWTSHAGVAVRILSNIFHLFTDRPEFQLLTFKTLLEIAGQANITNSIDLSLETVEEHIAEWKLNVEERREILRRLHNTLILDKRTNFAFEVMMALLQTYTKVDADKAKEDARECVRTAIVDPNSFSVDHLLRLNAVQSLEKSDPKIHQLLLLFSTGKLADYRGFISDNSSFIRDQLKVGIIWNKFMIML
jgi:translation initiation factor 3 subunit M